MFFEHYLVLDNVWYILLLRFDSKFAFKLFKPLLVVRRWSGRRTRHGRLAGAWVDSSSKTTGRVQCHVRRAVTHACRRRQAGTRAPGAIGPGRDRARRYRVAGDQPWFSWCQRTDADMDRRWQLWRQRAVRFSVAISTLLLVQRRRRYLHAQISRYCLDDNISACCIRTLPYCCPAVSLATKICKQG